MKFRNRTLALACSALGGLIAAQLTACAGMIDGEVDGESLPPMLSGIWIEGDTDGDGFQLSGSAASVLDLCGSMTAMTREQTTFVEAKAAAGMTQEMVEEHDEPPAATKHGFGEASMRADSGGGGGGGGAVSVGADA